MAAMSTPVSAPVSGAAAETAESRPSAPAPAKPRERARWLPIGQVSALQIGAGAKTSVVVDLAECRWMARIAPGQELEFRAKAWRGRQERTRPWAALAQVRVTGVCRHGGLEEVPGRGAHDPARIRPQEPAWPAVLEAAATRTLKQVSAGAIETVAHRGRWLVMDFALVGFTEIPALELPPPVKRRFCNPVERQIAEATSALNARKQAGEDAPELEADGRRLQLLVSAYAHRCWEVAGAGGTTASITMKDLDFGAAAERLERNAAKRAARQATGSA